MISIFQGKFFPFSFRAIGYVIPIVVLIKILTNSITELSLGFYGIALFAGGIFLLTDWTLEIHVREKIIRQNLSFLFFKVGSKYSYNRIERIYINRINGLYKSFIKLDDGEKSILDCNVDKDALIERLLVYNKELKTNILDNTILKDPQWIAIEQDMQ